MYKLNSSETCIKYFHCHSFHKKKKKRSYSHANCFLFLTDMSSKVVDIADTRAMENLQQIPEQASKETKNH